MICSATSNTCASSAHSVNDILIRDLNIDCIINILTDCCKGLIKCLSLRNCSRETVQNEALIAVILGQTVFNHPDENVNVTANIEQLGKTFMSILVNGIYAVQKKAQRENYEPQVTVTLSQEGGKAKVVIHDNGIGIESTIIDKIFDPFFTTKTTGEAAGVGLYLSKEIVQNHKGDITVRSEKDVYTEFTITLPTTT